MALASAAEEAVWMRDLCADLKSQPSDPTVIYEDKQSAICMARNPQFHGRTKHINIKFHFIREQVNADTIRIQYCPIEDMLADFLTKGVSTEKFVKLRKLCGMDQTVSSEKECGSIDSTLN